MNTLVPCPHCKGLIEPDSYFCDQCGAELLKCPKCGSLRKGKFCPTCGVATQKASQKVEAPQQPSQPQQFQQPQPPQQTQASQQPQGAPRPSTSPDTPVRLHCREAAIILDLIPGATIGRVNGQYASKLSRCGYISGTHARLDKNGTQWTITDLGSTNGTKVNGSRISPHSPTPFKVGDVIRIGSREYFYVE